MVHGTLCPKLARRFGPPMKSTVEAAGGGDGGDGKYAASRTGVASVGARRERRCRKWSQFQLIALQCFHVAKFSRGRHQKMVRSAVGFNQMTRS